MISSLPGITNTIGRVVWGGLSDLPQVRAIWVNNSTLILTAVVTALAPFCLTYVTMCIFAAFFGLFVGEFSSSCFCSSQSRATICSIVGAFRRLKQSRIREMSARGYALHSDCLQLSSGSFCYTPLPFQMGQCLITVRSNERGVHTTRHSTVNNSCFW